MKKQNPGTFKGGSRKRNTLIKKIPHPRILVGTLRDTASVAKTGVNIPLRQSDFHAATVDLEKGLFSLRVEFLHFWSWVQFLEE